MGGDPESILRVYFWLYIAFSEGGVDPMISIRGRHPLFFVDMISFEVLTLRLGSSDFTFSGVPKAQREGARGWPALVQGAQVPWKDRFVGVGMVRNGFLRPRF